MHGLLQNFFVEGAKSMVVDSEIFFMKYLYLKWNIQTMFYISMAFIVHNTVHIYITVFLITFEVWAKLAQQWLVCTPINKELMLLVAI